MPSSCIADLVWCLHLIGIFICQWAVCLAFKLAGPTAKAFGVPYFCKLIPHAPEYSLRYLLSVSFRWINFSLFDAGNSNILLFGALLFANDPRLRGPFKGEYHERPALGCIWEAFPEIWAIGPSPMGSPFQPLQCFFPFQFGSPYRFLDP